jgi:GNAT superfamily N-acetyltransferase
VSKHSAKVKIEIVTEGSEHLSGVKGLWRANSANLGFFPDGAFDDHARRRRILAAIDENGSVTAYLLFRTSHRKISIVHLCVHPDLRRGGVARELVKRVSSQNKEFLGIGLRCRRDFSANTLWPKLGFTAISELAGRGIGNMELTYWWLDHGHPNLFTELSRQQLAAKTTVTIDANIFFELFEPFSPDTEESKGLQADWLQDSIQLCLTGETLNEIIRANDPLARRQEREFARSFPHLEPEASSWELIAADLSSFFHRKDQRAMSLISDNLPNASQEGASSSLLRTGLSSQSPRVCTQSLDLWSFARAI